MKKKDKPFRIYVKDSAEEDKFLRRTYEVCRSYGGILFVSEFLLSKADALKLAEFIKDTWPGEKPKTAGSALNL